MIPCTLCHTACSPAGRCLQTIIGPRIPHLSCKSCKSKKCAASSACNSLYVPNSLLFGSQPPSLPYSGPKLALLPNNTTVACSPPSRSRTIHTLNYVNRLRQQCHVTLYTKPRPSSDLGHRVFQRNGYVKSFNGYGCASEFRVEFRYVAVSTHMQP
ncbi:hypothetical protein AB1N83_013722 [Pleurotus pulmonarius]